MFSTTHVTCDRCGAKAITREEGELPVGWFALIEMVPTGIPHRRRYSRETVLALHDWACVQAFVAEHPGPVTSASGAHLAIPLLA